jgi:PAS domain S-box-containing protein
MRQDNADPAGARPSGLGPSAREDTPGGARTSGADRTPEETGPVANRPAVATRLPEASDASRRPEPSGSSPADGATEDGPVARLRAELEASEARFRSIIERNADGVVIVDEAGVTRFVNPAAERMLGRSAGELVGEHIGIAAVPGETTEIDIVRPGAREETVAELRVSATTWEGAAAQLIMLRDITERRRSEQHRQRLIWERAARAQAEDAMRRAHFIAEAAAALDGSLDPHITLRNLSSLIVPRVADWCVIDLLDGTSIRRVAARHSDPDRSEALDELRRRYPVQQDERQPAGRVIRSGAPDLRRGVNADLVRAMAVDEDHAALLLRLGVRSWIAVPLEARGKKLGAITFVCGERDFTAADLALAQEIGSRAGQALDNARLYEAALIANRAKSDFLAIMSHELRTPLNAILGYTQLLLEGISGQLEEMQRHQLERVSASATHLLRIINDILAFASMEAGRLQLNLQEIPLRRVVEEVAAMVEPMVRAKELAFHIDIADPDTVIVTDAARLRQILLNLLGNAVKFTEAGSVTLRTALDGTDVVIEVEDTGPGVPEAERAAIFEPFRQMEGPLTRHEGGTGLGLPLARRMAGMLGGSIGLESELGTGTTFSLRLPRVPRNGTGV